MKNRVRILGIVAVVAIIGLSAIGCTTTNTFPLREGSWSHQTIIPNKDFVAIGAVVVRDTTEQSVIADLMDAAVALGGHDIINVRTTTTISTTLGLRKIQINSATATVIRYTDDTLIREWSDTLVNEEGGTIYENTETQYVGLDDGARRGSFVFGIGGGSSSGGSGGTFGGLFGRK